MFFHKLHRFLFPSMTETPEYIFYNLNSLDFFSFFFSDCFLYIRVYDCFSVWSQKLKYESEGN